MIIRIITSKAVVNTDYQTDNNNNDKPCVSVCLYCI